MQSTREGLKEHCAVVGSCQSIAAEASKSTQTSACIKLAAFTVGHTYRLHTSTVLRCVCRQLPEQCWQCSKSLLMRLRLCQDQTGRLPWPCQAKKHLQGVPCKLHAVCVLTVILSCSGLYHHAYCLMSATTEQSSTTAGRSRPALCCDVR